MKYKELDNDQLRFLTDIRQTYQAYLEAKEDLPASNSFDFDYLVASRYT